MIDLFIKLKDRIVHGTFETHLVVGFICLGVGIFIIQKVFYKLLKIITKKTNISYSLLHRAFKGIPTLLGILIGLYLAMDILDFPPPVLQFLQYLFRALNIMTLTLFIAHLCSSYFKQKVGKPSSNFGATSILPTAIDLIVYSLGFLLLLESFGISISPLLTALGIGGLATALALQDTLTNLFSGINMLVSGQIKIGDFVRLATGEEGQVVDLNWRNTTIKTPSENMVVVPNQKIASSTLTNYAQPFAECSITIPLGVSYGSNLAYVEKITIAVAHEILQETEGGVTSFEPYIRYVGFAGSSINFYAILRVKTFTDQDLVRHEFIKRLYTRYEKENIILAFTKGKVPDSIPDPTGKLETITPSAESKSK